MKDKVIPGDNLKLEATLKSFRRGIAKGSCKAFKNEQPILEIEIVEILPSQMVKML